MNTNWLERAQANFTNRLSRGAAKPAARPTLDRAIRADTRAPSENSDEISGRWLIVEPPSKTERWFIPPVSRSELSKDFPRATLIPLPDLATAPNRAPETATEAEALELDKLVSLVGGHYDCLEVEIAEMLLAAGRDPKGALMSFRILARELNLDGGA